ncbi:MAG: NifU family protein [Solirubrobacteraceae bacterium]
MSADDQTSGERWLDMTNAAYDKVTGFLLQVAEPERQAMWIEVTGTSANQWTCSISLKPLDAAAPYDAIVRHRDLAIVVPECDFDKVRGATIDWLDDPFGTSGLRVDNPNTPSPAIGAPPPADLSGDVAQRVIQVLDQQVNPAIAGHGGRAELVAVEQGTAYLRLGGGCQGCAMATVTLSQGIERSIIQAVPEITNVVDVTDHQSGTNPYFETAKK